MPRMGEDLSREIRTLSRINVLQRPHPSGPAEGRLFVLSIQVPKYGAALLAAEPKTKGHPSGCPFVLEARGEIDILI